MALTRRERLRAQDLEECGRVGEQFGLGAAEFVGHDFDDQSGLRWLGRSASSLGFLGLTVGWPIAAGLRMSPSWYVGVIADVVMIAGPPLMIIGKRLAGVSVRQCLYSGGLAHIDRKAAEPAVLRWADVEVVTIETGDDDGTPTTSLIGCTLRGRTGLVMRIHQDIMGPVAVAAHRALAPRIVSAMIYTYNSGQPVIAAPNAQVDQWGITFPRKKDRRAWTDIGVVVMEHSAAGPTLTTRINLQKAGKARSRNYCDPSRVPNGIFLADLIAHAARQRGLPVRGYAGPGFGRLLSVLGPKALP
jgi:hypothetical protein